MPKSFLLNGEGETATTKRSTQTSISMDGLSLQFQMSPVCVFLQIFSGVAFLRGVFLPEVYYRNLFLSLFDGGQKEYLRVCLSVSFVNERSFFFFFFNSCAWYGDFACE